MTIKLNFYLDAAIGIKGNYISILIAALNWIINSEINLSSSCETKRMQRVNF